MKSGESLKCGGMECVDSGGCCGVKSVGRMWRVMKWIV